MIGFYLQHNGLEQLLVVWGFHMLLCNPLVQFIMGQFIVLASDWYVITIVEYYCNG